MLVYAGKTTKEYSDFYSSAPQEILIETVGPCNLRCVGCPQSLEEYRKAKWNPAFMDYDLYARILKQVKDLWRPINVGLYHTGEITLLPHEKFDLYTRTAKEILPDSDGWDSVGFYTNGLLLDAERRASVIKNGINWVRLSFDGGDKESYEAVRIGSDFQTVYDNAIALAREATEADVRIRLEVIFVPYTENELKIAEFQKLWWHTGWKAYTGGSMNYGGLMTKEVEARRHRYQEKRRARHSIPCPRIFEQFSVLVDGRVSLCSADPMGLRILGDLNKETIKEVWDGLARDLTLNIHKDLSGGGAVNMSPCDSCDYTEYCAVPNGEYFGEINE